MSSSTGIKIDYSTGSVGIGTTRPNATLDTKGNLLVSGNVGIGTTIPQFPLDVNGFFTAKNPYWYLTNSSGANATYDTAAKIWGSSIGNSVYFNRILTYNNANANAFNVSTGLFTFPLDGVYTITINMFINGATTGRTGIISFYSSIYPLNQYFTFDNAAIGSNYQRSYTMTKLCNKNDSFVIYTESGSITLFWGDIHSTLFVQKIG